MANKKNNQRFRDTERSIEDAAIDLVEEGVKLTVRAVCERAGVNRSTFYAHFVDIPSMVGKLEARLDEELIERYLNIRESGTPQVTPLSAESFLPFLEHISIHRRFYRVALAARRNFPLEQGRDQMWRELVEPLSRSAGITDEEHMMCLFVSFQAGFTMVLRRWVESDCRESVGHMAEILASCAPIAWHRAVSLPR